MMYKQLVRPNLDVYGSIGYCLAFAEAVFNTPKKYPYATNAWKATKYKHQDQNFPVGCSVPIWFSYVINGIDEGHVCVRLSNGKLLSSPWKPGTSQATLNSIAQLIEIYSNNGEYPMHYLGWSEDLNGLRIVEPIAAPKPVPKPTGGTATVIRETFVRSAPKTSAPLAGSRILPKGSTFLYTAKIKGEDVNENGIHTNLWYHSTLGHYVWSGNAKD